MICYAKEMHYDLKEKCIVYGYYLLHYSLVTNFLILHSINVIESDASNMIAKVFTY